MIKRPKRNETLEDILRMQEEFMAEKAKNPRMQPAAQVVKMGKPPKKSLFAQSRMKTAQDSPEIPSVSKADEMKSPAIPTSTQPAETSTKPAETATKQLESSRELLSEIHEKIVGTTPAQPTTISDIVLGDIVEKQFGAPKAFNFRASETPLAFPKVERRKGVQNSSTSGKSLFAQAMETDEVMCNSAATEPQQQLNNVHHLSSIYGQASAIVEDAKTASEIHQENVELLSKMREEEILAERRQLLDSIDPSLVALLAKRRQEKAAAAAAAAVRSPTAAVEPPKSLQKIVEESSEAMDCTAALETEVPTEGISLEKTKLDLPDSNAAIEILQRSSAEKWINFDVVEKDKLEWMRDVPAMAAKLQPGEKFEARFDWKGVLLPYSTEATQKTSVEKDERELYLHGEEPHRPGYTLQELFRLARSNVMQQRVSAFTAIGGILNIYNQGFYDQVLELPITKIFFLLRFGFDDNAPALLEVVSKALTYLFYNETDETLLDFIYDNPGAYWQPTLQVTETQVDAGDTNALENLQRQMQQLQISSGARNDTAIAANVNESEEESRTTMSDFQLAETDLIDCLLRTNILQRIYFILHTERPDNSTVSSCLKLLIRIARTGKAEAIKIVNNEDLMHCLIDNFLPGLEKIDTSLIQPPFYNYPQYLCLKLMRVLIAQNLSIAIKLMDWNLVDKLQNYLFTQYDIKDKLIRVQIEALRIVRCLLLLRVDNALYKKFSSAFRYMLEWHLHHVNYEVGGSMLIRQHAAAVLAAITSSPCNSETVTLLGAALHDCCCSWFYKANLSGVNEFSQATLLSACLNAVAWYTRNSDTLERFRNFQLKYLRDFIESAGFVRLIETLQSSSIVLRDVPDRRNIHPALPNVGSVLVHKLGPQLIVPQTYCVYLLSTLWRLLELQLELYQQRSLIDLLIQPKIVEPIVGYLSALATRSNRYLATNFFAKSELRLIYSLLCFSGFSAYLPKAKMLQITYNFICCLTAEFIPEIEHLFERVIFHPDYISTDEAVLKKWRSTCLELVYPHYIVVPTTELTLSMPCMRAPMLPTDWPYFQLKIILHNYIENVQQKPAVIFSEREVIHMTFTFVSLLEECNPKITIASPTEKLMYLMIAFMGPDSQFLEPEMRTLLRSQLVNFYKQYRDYKFDFDADYEGKCKFENLYALFVDHFQAASYGDELFGSLVLVPLAQKYDNKWRRRVWSDYAAALRFLDCDDELVLGGIEAYLEPPEEEESLLKAYTVALKTNLVRPNMMPYKIAQHHVAKFKERMKKL